MNGLRELDIKNIERRRKGRKGGKTHEDIYIYIDIQKV